MIEQDSLKQLRELIDLWINKSPETRNLAVLAKDSCVSESTLRRMYNCQAMGSVDKLLNILVFLSEKKTLKEISETFGGPISEHLKERFPAFFDQDDIRKELNDVCTIGGDLLKDFQKYVLIKKITHNNSFMTKDRVALEFGERGIRELEFLIEIGIVFEENGFLKSKIKEFLITHNIAKHHVRELIDCYWKPEGCGKGGSASLDNISQTVSIEGYKKIKEHLYNCGTEVIKIMDSHPGEIPFMYITVMDTLTSSVMDIFKPSGAKK